MVKNGKLTHLDGSGKARMVDVGSKDITRRTARASVLVTMSAETAKAIRDNSLKKGEALSVASVAGIMAAKKVDELIPLAHSLPLDRVNVDFEFVEEGIKIYTEAVASYRTGVELEAMTAAAAAALTVYDMAKSMERGMTITDLRLDFKAGGKSGTWTREGE